LPWKSGGRNNVAVRCVSKPMLQCHKKQLPQPVPNEASFSKYHSGGDLTAIFRIRVKVLSSLILY